MPLLRQCPHCSAGGNENRGRRDSPARCTSSWQEESEEESKNSPSQRPKRAGANYGLSALLVKKQSKAKGGRKMAAEDKGEEKSPA
eukprot:4263005-Ditylum_brightwellii.AAC.1